MGWSLEAASKCGVTRPLDAAALTASPCPGKLHPTYLAEDRCEVLEDPLLADLPGVVDAVDVEALESLTESTSASGTPWALGVEARSRALLAQGEEAEALYRQAIERLQPTRLRLDRSHLVYGEWLRRQARRIEALNELRAAYELFSGFEMEAFAERSRIELEATGGHARKRSFATLDQLTAQEAQICRLAAEGNTNREIAAQLFISPSTVEYHLRKAFRKLDVTSRTQLAKKLR
jgi:DNA-binding CsgD family transcriptional regulator